MQMLENALSSNVTESEGKTWDPSPDLDPNHNFMGSILTHSASFHQVVMKYKTNTQHGY